MHVAEPSINEVFGEFLAEEQRRLAPLTFRRYEDVIGLLRGCLDGYAYESLPNLRRGGPHRRVKVVKSSQIQLREGP